MRAFVELWDEITRERYGVEDPKMRRFRYGVQVNSLGLTEAQPENNVQRIVLEMLGVTLSKSARARAVQLPAWNEALGLPRPWDQQWSLRLQQVLAFESDLLEYDDIFDGSPVIEAKVAELVAGAKAEIDRVQAMGGAIAAVESGYMKQALVSAHAARRAAIESGEEKIVGVNIYETTEPSPLTADLDAAIMAADPEAEKTALASVEAWKARARRGRGRRGTGRARRGRQDRHQPDGRRPSGAARAGATTGEWAGTLREVFGEFRAPTGVSGAVGVAEAGAELSAVRRRVTRDRRRARRPAAAARRQAGTRRSLQRRRAGRRPRPGRRLRGHLPGHPAHARADRVGRRGRGRALRRACRSCPGSHMELVPAVLDGLRAAGLDDVPVIVGGIIPDSDARRLTELGRRRGLHAQGLRTDRDHGRDRRGHPPGPRTLLRHASR